MRRIFMAALCAFPFAVSAETFQRFEGATISIAVGDLIISAPSDLLSFSEEAPGKARYVRVVQLLAPDGESFPVDPAFPQQKDLSDHGAMAFRAGEGLDAVVQRVTASGQTSAAHQEDLLDGFDAVRFRYLLSDVTAYTATDAGLSLLGTPLTVFCEDATAFHADQAPARFCRIAAPTGTGTALTYSFYDNVWRPDQWPLLARALEHTACLLIAEPQVCPQR